MSLETLGVIIHYVILLGWSGTLVWVNYKISKSRELQEKEVSEVYDLLKEVQALMKDHEEETQESLRNYEEQVRKSLEEHVREGNHLTYRLWSLEQRLENNTEKLNQSASEIRAWIDLRMKRGQ